ncbi:IclR family transcriptional regulator [Klugiella xanthotipulae]|uniref:Glycerol operon regulatory protein n=1 Tax=Klugiella xanthotipulae TaxID=244735 RepID=A0A543HH97_9MICO|nr:IclR family transcriptional regulator [Klugiella xanthotipulae]TQM57705.1 IclR family transcriptional regulator [Klugiella xanthotipulae]
MSESSHVPAADNTLRILRLLATSRGPLPASMIATRLELPRSSVYHLLSVLERNGFVMHLPEEKRYGLGIAAVELSSAYARQEPLSRLGRPVLAGLVDRLGLSAHLAVLHGRDVLYIVEERARNAPSLVTDVDVRLPSHLTASGRAILAALPRAQVRALFPTAAAFVQRHNESDGVNRYSRLRAVLDGVTTRGYAVEEGEVTSGLSSVAVAVADHRDWPVAGLAVTFRPEDLPLAGLPAVVDAVRGTAAELSRRIYGRAVR